MKTGLPQGLDNTHHMAVASGPAGPVSTGPVFAMVVQTAHAQNFELTFLHSACDLGQPCILPELVINIMQKM